MQGTDMRRHAAIVGLVSGAVLVGLAGGCSMSITSPNGQVRTRVRVADDGRLTYRVERAGQPIILDAPLGIVVDAVDLGEGVKTGRMERYAGTEAFAWRGTHSHAVNPYRGARIPVRHVASDTRYTLEVRAFDDGVAWQYVVPRAGAGRVGGEATAFVLPDGASIWFQTNTANYEGIHKKKAVSELEAGQFMGMPVTIELPDGTYAAITEAALFNYSGMTLRHDGAARLVGVFQDDPEGWPAESEIRTPWRVVLTGPDLNTLVNSTVIPALCPPPDPQLFPEGMNTAWIRPGRNLWHWWSSDSIGFTEQKAWIDAASALGFDGYLVDEGWDYWPDGGRDKWDLLKELVDYARQRNVDLWVWKACPDRNNVPGIMEAGPRQEFLKRCKAAGVTGVKIDFMDSESKAMVDFDESTLREAAALQLMVNFHGANKPTGEPRTYPNEMTREGIRGLEYNKWSALPPHHYASLPFTRMLAGHADFTPCTFNPEYLKGTTVTQQLATAIVYTSPLLHWADKAEWYQKSSALELVKEIPTCWDETRVLPGSAIGELAAFARRKGDAWYIAVLNGGEARELRIDVSKLGGSPWSATLVEDVPDDPARMTVRNRDVASGETITVSFNAGGGFVARLRPR